MNTDLHIYFLNMVGAPALATCLLIVFYVMASYVPSLVLTALVGKKEEGPPKSGYVYAKEDIINF